MKPATEAAKRRSIRVTYEDGRMITTEIRGTEAEISMYYLGPNAIFNFGDRDFGDPDNLQRAVRVEFLD